MRELGFVVASLLLLAACEEGPAPEPERLSAVIVTRSRN